MLKYFFAVQLGRLSVLFSRFWYGPPRTKEMSERKKDTREKGRVKERERSPMVIKFYLCNPIYSFSSAVYIQRNIIDIFEIHVCSNKILSYIVKHYFTLYKRSWQSIAIFLMHFLRWKIFFLSHVNIDEGNMYLWTRKSIGKIQHILHL